VIELDKRTRDALAATLARYLKDEFSVEIGRMEAVVFLDFMAERLGPHFYNQALRDGQAHLHVKLDALSEALHDLEKPAKL
jgi:uncharacterized protein (DUF2164 family)